MSGETKQQTEKHIFSAAWSIWNKMEIEKNICRVIERLPRLSSSSFKYAFHCGHWYLIRVRRHLCLINTHEIITSYISEIFMVRCTCIIAAVSWLLLPLRLHSLTHSLTHSLIHSSWCSRLSGHYLLPPSLT